MSRWSHYQHVQPIDTEYNGEIISNLEDEALGNPGFMNRLFKRKAPRAFLSALAAVSLSTQLMPDTEAVATTKVGIEKKTPAKKTTKKASKARAVGTTSPATTKKPATAKAPTTPYPEGTSAVSEFTHDGRRYVAGVGNYCIGTPSLKDYRIAVKLHIVDASKTFEWNKGDPLPDPSFGFYKELKDNYDGSKPGFKYSYVAVGKSGQQTKLPELDGVVVVDGDFSAVNTLYDKTTDRITIQKKLSAGSSTLRSIDLQKGFGSITMTLTDPSSGIELTRSVVSEPPCENDDDTAQFSPFLDNLKQKVFGRTDQY